MRQVFIGGKLVGGADEVIEMLGDGRLQDIIAEAAADSPLPREVDSLVAAIEAAPKERSSSLPVGG